MLVKTHIGLHLCRWNCGSQVSHAHQIVGSAGKGKDPVHFVDPTMSNLAQERNRLQPAKAFFNPLSLSLTDDISRVPRSTAINRASAWPRMVLRHVGRDPQIPALLHEIAGVEPFIAPHADRLPAGKF